MSHVNYLILAGIASFLIGVLLKIRKKLEIDYVFKMYPDLRKVEKDVTRHIYLRGGEVWEVEIRETFKLPKANFWKLAKRLEDKGIITIRKDGPLIQLKLKKYPHREGFSSRN